MSSIHPSGDDHWTRRTPDRLKRGYESHAAKLCAADIEALCAEFRVRQPARTWLAHKYGVSRATVWRHLKAAGLL
jgi:transcriptional regulator of acetoin/glycerol metabolism